jgi:hypothetical protein
MEICLEGNLKKSGKTTASYASISCVCKKKECLLGFTHLVTHLIHPPSLYSSMNIVVVSTFSFFSLQRMMAELAPQDKTGTYQRPKYSFGGTIGSTQFPVEAGRYHLYLGNPCPVSYLCISLATL